MVSSMDHMATGRAHRLDRRCRRRCSIGLADQRGPLVVGSVVAHSGRRLRSFAVRIGGGDFDVDNGPGRVPGRAGHGLAGFRLIGFRLIGHRLIGHRLIGHRLIGHRLIGHRLIGHRLIGHRLIGDGNVRLGNLRLGNVGDGDGVVGYRFVGLGRRYGCESTICGYDEGPSRKRQCHRSRRR
jgi:hypothetical protein